MVEFNTKEKSPVTCSLDTYVLDENQNPFRSDWSKCVCPPQPCAKLCQPSKSLKTAFKSKGRGHQKTSVIAYMRLGGNQLSKDEQLRTIKYYCEEHDLELADVFSDQDKPSYGLQEALREVENHDALIAVNLNSFVEHDQDRIRDLRPFIHHFFCRRHKHLIAIQEGIDTGTPSGQQAAIDLSSQVKETF